MVAHIEEFKILGRSFAIEDYEDGKPADQHFFFDDRQKRYRLWTGGSGFGTANTLAEARQMVLDYARAHVAGQLASAQLIVDEATTVLLRLGMDTAHLFRFETK